MISGTLLYIVNKNFVRWVFIKEVDVIRFEFHIYTYILDVTVDL
jgi:hypothetical protein